VQPQNKTKGKTVMEREQLEHISWYFDDPEILVQYMSQWDFKYNDITAMRKIKLS
jgi:hypothetical protein